MGIVVGSKEKPARLSFVHLMEPTPSMSGDRNIYSVQVVVPKDDKAGIAAIKAEIDKAITDGIGKKMFNKATSLNPEFRRCFRDGDQKAAEVDDGSQDYLKNCMFFNASCSETRPPAVVNRFGKPIVRADEVYSGCYGLVSVNFYPFKHGKGGIAAGLNHVMVREDGERLDGRETADKAFAGLADSEEEDMSPSEGGDDLR